MLPANFSVIALQEIWSVSKMYDLTGYNDLIYKTRDMNTEPNSNCGGGVGFFVSKNFQFEILEEESVFISGVYESLWIKVQVDKCKFKIIGNIYRPNTAPRANLKLAIETHASIITKIKSNKNHSKCSIEIASDFNVDLLKFQEHNKTNEYFEVLLSFGLLPTVTKPTRISHNSATLIDHIFVSNQSKFHYSGIIISEISDHFPIFYIDQSNNQKPKPQPYQTRKINSETQTNLNNLLKTTSFENIINQSNPSEAFQNFFDICHSATDISFPVITVRPKSTKFSHSPWMTPGLLISSKTKQKLFNKKLNSPTQVNVSKFKYYNNIYNMCRHRSQQLYYSKRFTDCKDDLKTTWKLIREVSCSRKVQKDNLPDYFRWKGNIIRGPQEIANNFNRYFTEVGPDLASKIPDSKKHFSNFLGTPNKQDFKFSEMSEIRILNFIKNMKPKSSFGEDCISNNVLKLIAPTIIQPLKHLINISLTTGYFPDQFKIAKVIPIFKESDCHEFSNFRPISLLNSISRLFESIVCFQVTGFTDACDILYKHQYGFRAKHNINHPLLHFTDNIFNALNNNKFNISIFIDLKKAFDTVNYDILLKKLEHYGIRNTELLWFKNYLQNRQQYVHLSKIAGVSNVNSSKLQCKSGIPQGSCLGPLLFLIFINDLPNATDLSTLLFADDCTFQISGSNSQSLIRLANLELEKAECWFNSNKLTINAKKTKYIFYKNQSNHVHLNDLFISNSAITRVGQFCDEKSVRFLGIWIDDALTFSGHISKLKSKLNSGLYALSSCNKIVPIKIRKTKYSSLVESHLRFGSIIYGAANPKLLEPISVMQRKAIRLVARASYNAHTDELFKKYRFLKYDDLVQLNQCIFLRQYSNKQLPTSFCSMFQYLPLSQQVYRDDDYNVKPKVVNFKSLSFLPIIQLIRSWNRSSLLVKAEGEINALKDIFITQKLNSYAEECDKLICYVCKRT